MRHRCGMPANTIELLVGGGSGLIPEEFATLRECDDALGPRPFVVTRLGARQLPQPQRTASSPGHCTTEADPDTAR
jgi:hypothetical protein